VLICITYFIRIRDRAINFHGTKDNVSVLVLFFEGYNPAESVSSSDSTSSTDDSDDTTDSSDDDSSDESSSGDDSSENSSSSSSG
jgi:hypothetical protein